MNARERERYKKLLLEKQKELSAATTEARNPIPPAGSTQGDIIDQAAADLEAELQIRLRRTDGRLMRAIEEALVRVEQPTFGTCQECGEPISKARLEAVPWTRLCLPCKEKSSG